MWQKRHGLQLASQLPDSLEDALLVLRYAREIIEGIHAEATILPFNAKEA